MKFNDPEMKIKLFPNEDILCATSNESTTPEKPVPSEAPVEEFD